MSSMLSHVSSSSTKDEIAEDIEMLVLKVLVRHNTEQFGPDHLDTLKAKYNVSNFLVCELGEVKEARRLYKEVIRGYTELLGPDHTDTQHAMSSLHQLDQLCDIRNMSSGKTTNAFNQRFCHPWVVCQCNPQERVRCDVLFDGGE
jgi:hypothetical protein